MRGGWEPDPRVIGDITGSSGTKYTLRRDGIAFGLAKEAQEYLDQFPSSDPAVGLIQRELALCIEALRLGATAGHAGENLVALVFSRVIIESTIRLSWVFADCRTDPAALRKRLDRLTKLDLDRLYQANKAVLDLGLGCLVTIGEGSGDQARARFGRLSAAPDNLRTMAREAGWEWLYALHRFCSATLHPGLYAAARITDELRPDELLVLLHWSFSGAVMAASGILQSLVPDSQRSALKWNSLCFKTRGFLLQQPLPATHAPSDG